MGGGGGDSSSTRIRGTSVCECVCIHMHTHTHPNNHNHDAQSLLILRRRIAWEPGKALPPRRITTSNPSHQPYRDCSVETSLRDFWLDRRPYSMYTGTGTPRSYA